jgi:tRNA threonylcarbamoyladenosine biosynthesis protein TsaE
MPEDVRLQNQKAERTGAGAKDDTWPSTGTCRSMDLKKNKHRMTGIARDSETAAQIGTVVLVCPVEEDLGRLANAVAQVLKPGDVVFLRGGLGAGKTTLTRYLAHALGVGADQYVSSPSFALLHEYNGRLPVYHMDCYRLDDEVDVEEAGLRDFLEQGGVTIIEWPERFGSLTPSDRLEIRLEADSAGKRHVTLEPYGQPWRVKLMQVARSLDMSSCQGAK